MPECVLCGAPTLGTSYCSTACREVAEDGPVPNPFGIEYDEPRVGRIFWPAATETDVRQLAQHPDVRDEHPVMFRYAGTPDPDAWVEMGNA